MAAQTAPRASAPKTPVAIVTGFLGSGKTTQINLALSDPKMRGALVIVNEFGEVGLDNVLMAASSDHIVVLENGCLCCTVFGDLIGTLFDLYHRRLAGAISFDRVVIETSGLADPTSVVQAFLSDPTLDGLYRLCSMVALIDAVNFEATLRNYDEAVRQIALASTIVVTKLDLIPDAEREARMDEIRSAIADLNRGAAIIAVPPPPESLAGILCLDGPRPDRTAGEAERWLGSVYGEGSEGHSHNHALHGPHRLFDHMPVGTLTYVRDDPLPRRALELLLSGIERNLGPNLLRLKAIVTIEGEDSTAVIHGAQHLLHNIEWLPFWPFEDRKSRFVLIAAGITTEPLREMVSLLDRIATRSAIAAVA